jgi:hypothetical protein
MNSARVTLTATVALAAVVLSACSGGTAEPKAWPSGTTVAVCPAGAVEPTFVWENVTGQGKALVRRGDLRAAKVGRGRQAPRGERYPP